MELKMEVFYKKEKGSETLFFLLCPNGTKND